MSKPKVVVARMTPGLEGASLWDECDVWAWREDRIIPPEILLEHVGEAEGLYATSFDPIGQAILDAAPRLKVVANYGVGVDNVDLAAMTARGIPVGNTPGVVTEATADMTMALMLALSRRIVNAANFVTGKRWETWSPELMISHDVFGKTVGIVGAGRIGRAIAKRCHGFSMRILYHARSAKPALEATYGAQYRSLPDLLAQSDIVVTILPLTPDTQHMINKETLAMMKPGALLINTARGAVVDPKALYEALASGHLGGAALDVTVPEPIGKDDPLLSLENCLIAPHIATSTWEAREAMTRITVTNILNGLAGQPLLHCANP